MRRITQHPTARSGASVHRLGRYVALLAAAAVLAGCSSSDTAVVPLTVPGGDTATAGSTSTEGDAENTSTPVADDRPALTIVLDGWSYEQIVPSSLQWRDAGGRIQTLSLRPAGRADVDALLARDPGVIVDLLARTVTADPTLACTSDGCTANGAAVDLDTLVDLRLGSVLGPMYQAWGIDTGVWLAELPRADATVQYGSSAVTFTTSAPRGNEPAGGVELGEAYIDPIDPTSAGDDSGVRTIGAAWGRLFELDAAWIGGTYPYGTPTVVGGRTLDTLHDPTLFYQGLGTRNLGADGLSNTQLTWRTSPTTGCGVGVACIPGVVETSVENLESTTHAVCDDDGRTAHVVLVALDAAIVYPHATHQYGMWNGQRPDAALGERGNAVWRTAVPLVSGSTRQHHAIAYLYDGNTIIDTTGRGADHAVDTPAALAHRYTANDISTLFGGAWRAC